MRTILSLCIAVSLSASFAACGSDSSDSGDGSTGDGSSDACASADAPTYDTFGKAFLDDYCASCHAASVTGDARLGAPPEDVFDTLEQVKAAEADELINLVVTTKSMPFGVDAPKPSDEERATFGTWIECGVK